MDDAFPETVPEGPKAGILAVGVALSTSLMAGSISRTSRVALSPEISLVMAV